MYRLDIALIIAGMLILLLVLGWKWLLLMPLLIMVGYAFGRFDR